MKMVAFDTETTGLQAWQGDKPFMFGFCYPDGRTECLQLTVNPYTRQVLPSKPTLARVAQILENRKITKIMHHAKFDTRMMEQGWGIKIRGPIHDTMYMAHACNSRDPMGLKALRVKYLGYPKDDEVDLKKAVVAARRIGKKQQWALGCTIKFDPDGSRGYEPCVQMDYWMPKAVTRTFPELLDEATLQRWAEICSEYCCGDVQTTFLLFEFYRKVMGKTKGAKLAYETEGKLHPVTYAMESRGVRIHRGVLQIKTEDAQQRRLTQLEYLRSRTWPDFNPEAPAQVRKMLFGSTLGLTPTAFTPKSNEPTVDQKTLRQYVNHPEVAALLRYRRASKSLSLFFLKHRELLVRKDGCGILHADFRQVGPATRRFACADPNLQNLTDKDSGRMWEPEDVRGPFGPRPGYCWLLFDYSQLEVRLFADLGNEKKMLAALARGENLHVYSCNEAYGGKNNLHCALAAVNLLELDISGADPGSAVRQAWRQLGVNKWNVHKLDEDDRESIALKWVKGFNYNIADAEASLGKKKYYQRCKSLNFAKIYGGGPNAVMLLLECSYSEAEESLVHYDHVFPRIPEFMEEMSARARKYGYILNAYGIRINVNTDKPYQAVNNLIQSSAASLLKRAMLNCHNYLVSQKLDAHLVMTLHDELIFEVKKEQATKRLMRKLRRVMEDHGGVFRVKTPVDVERTDTSWTEKVKVDLPKRKKIV